MWPSRRSGGPKRRQSLRLSRVVCRCAVLHTALPTRSQPTSLPTDFHPGIDRTGHQPGVHCKSAAHCMSNSVFGPNCSSSGSDHAGEGAAAGGSGAGAVRARRGAAPHAGQLPRAGGDAAEPVRRFYAPENSPRHRGRGLTFLCDQMRMRPILASSIQDDRSMFNGGVGQEHC